MNQKSNKAQVSSVKVQPMDQITETVYTHSDVYCASGVGLVIGTLFGLTLCIALLH